jgi:hypothetical protein
VHADHPSVAPLALKPPDPAAPASESTEPSDTKPNRATRRGKRGSVPTSTHARGATSHARGVQGRRINPVRRTG